jgi:HEAT repeat protein
MLTNSANIPFFCEALKSESWLVRTESAIALTKLNKEEVLKQLVVLQNDSAEVVRNNARWVIRELSNSD